VAKSSRRRRRRRSNNTFGLTTDNYEKLSD